jgi:hypothetical protein
MVTSACVMTLLGVLRFWEKMSCHHYLAIEDPRTGNDARELLRYLPSRAIPLRMAWVSSSGTSSDVFGSTRASTVRW